MLWRLRAGDESGLEGVGSLLPALQGPADSAPGSKAEQDRCGLG